MYTSVWKPKFFIVEMICFGLFSWTTTKYIHPFSDKRL
jgi:hypothetical protein